MNEGSKEGAVTGVPRLLLRLEGAALLSAGIFLYWKAGASWWLFALLVLVPDLSFLAYLGGARLGAIIYNAVHTLIGPLVLGLAGFILPAFDLIAIALIWVTHIGVDRMLGFGLKYSAGFHATHLGQVGISRLQGAAR